MTIMRVQTCCKFSIVLMCFFNSTIAQLSISVSQSTGNDSKCTNSVPSMPCRTLKYTLDYVLTSNQTLVDINFVQDSQYDVYSPLDINTGSRSVTLRFFSKLFRRSRMSSLRDISLRCTTQAQSIFIVNGVNLNLEFHNITFSNCGNGEGLPALRVNDTLKVSFYSCTFQDNSCGALFVMNSDLHIENSSFFNNSVDANYVNIVLSSFSGGIGILFENEGRNMSVTVLNTIFVQNSVHVDENKYYAAQKHPNAVLNGGAMHVIFQNSTYWTTINISQCYCQRNRATFGGAFVFELFNALHKNVFVTSSQFFKNSGSQAGGALMYSIWDDSGESELAIVDTLFQENYSRSGSAFYVFIQSRHVSKSERKDIFLFKRLKVIRNFGPAASGIKIASRYFGPRSISQVPIIEDCLFINNTNKMLNGYAYLATCIFERVNIIFRGENQFIGNRFFGAALFSNSIVQVFDKLHFYRNSGLNGGAISMQDSQIVINPNADLLFQENYAIIGGGAINVVTNPVFHIGVVGNPFCFFIYAEDVDPSLWKAKIRFLNNAAAVIGPAIFINSLVMCAWESSSKTMNFGEALKLQPPFYYSGNILCSDPRLFLQCNKSATNTVHPISTFAASLNERHFSKTIKSFPGEETVLDMVAKDELNTSIFTIIADKIATDDYTTPLWLKSRETFTAIQNNDSFVKLKYNLNNYDMPINTTANVYYYDVFSNGRIFTKFTLYPQPCRPGFIQNNGSCVCDKSHSAILGCTTDSYFVQYEEGYWVGLVNDSSGRPTFTVEPCPFGYCSCPKYPLQHDIEKRGCFFNAVNGTDVCANKRTGILCGVCKENYSVGIQTFLCVSREQKSSCTWTTVFSFIFTFLFCVLVLYFNPGLDNELRGPLFFFQVLPLFFRPTGYTSDGSINVYNFVFSLASIFNFTLPFFGYFFSDCYIMNGLDNLEMLAWSFSSFVVALVVFVTTILLGYKRLIFVRRKNAVQSFWVLLILMYSSLIMTSLRIVDCQEIQGEYRLFFQASIICYEGTHLAMAVVAYILLFLGVIIPLLIFDFTKTNRIKIAPHYLDTLTNKLKPKCVFWWSIDLLRRFLLVVIGDLLSVWKDKQVILIMATTFILSIHCYFQPYEEARANLTEMFFLFVLSALGVFQLMDIDDKYRDRANLGIVSVMFICALVLFLIKLVIFLRKRFCWLEPENDELERLRAAETYTNYSVGAQQALDERRERLAYLFARSESPNTDAQTQN